MFEISNNNVLHKLSAKDIIDNRDYIWVGFNYGFKKNSYLYYEMEELIGDQKIMMRDKESFGWYNSSGGYHAEEKLLWDEGDLVIFLEGKEHRRFLLTAYCFYSPCSPHSKDKDHNCTEQINRFLDKYNNLSFEFKFSFIFKLYKLTDTCKTIKENLLGSQGREDGRFSLRVMQDCDMEKMLSLLSMNISKVSRKETNNYLNEMIK